MTREYPWLVSALAPLARVCCGACLVVEFGWGVTNVSRATTTMRIGVIAVWAHHVTMRRVLSLQDVCLLMT
jgi:hypothetical protein